MTLNSIGRWFSLKYQQQARERGHYTTAKALRKQGVPLEVALALLFGSSRSVTRAACELRTLFPGVTWLSYDQAEIALQRIASAARCVA